MKLIEALLLLVAAFFVAALAVVFVGFETVALWLALLVMLAVKNHVAMRAKSKRET